MASPGYVRSTDGDNADDGSTWALANATLTGGFADAAAGDRIWISNNHAESTAAEVVLTSPGTAASPCEILCGNDAAEPPTSLATTATITTTLGSNIRFAGFAYYRGLSFIAGSGASATASIAFNATTPWWHRLENCVLRIASTGISSRVQVGISANSSDDSLLELVNTSIRFGSTSQGIIIRSPLKWTGGSVDSAGSAPTALFTPSGAGNASVALIENVDLSHVSGSLVDVSSGSPSRFRFVNCKLHASVSITTGANPGQGGSEVVLVNCDSGDTQYRYRKHNYLGDEYHETTVVRTGGASDGTTSFARKITTSANSKFICPFESEYIPVWCDSLASTTLTVEVITDNVTLTDAEAWIDVTYQGTSGFPLGVLISDAKADILASAANQTTSSETWTTTGLTTPVKQKLSVTFTPAEKGWALVRVNLAKASTTMYYCPKVDKT